MSAPRVITAVLLALAVVITLLSTVGLWLMRDPLQRLHFLGPPAMLSSVLVAGACLLDDPGWIAGGKAVLIAVLLAIGNGVLGHATARAACLHADGQEARARTSKAALIGKDGRVVGEVDLVRPDPGASA